MPRARPNILMLVSDQQRADTIHALGNDIIRTPVMDRLVGEGTAFRRAYTPCPVCAPARHSMATGLAPHRGLQTDNFFGPSVDVPDFPSLLQAAGYQTYGYGKDNGTWNCGSKRGFDEWLSSADYQRWFQQQGIDWIATPRGSGGEYYYMPMVMPYPAKYDRTHWVADRTIDFLQGRSARPRDPDRPFLLCAHFGRPHPAWDIPYPWFFLYRACQMAHPLRPANFREYRCRVNLFQNRYKGMEEACDGGDDLLLRRIRAAYYAGISYLDWNIGRILEALGDEIDDTLIIYTTDHGEMLGDYGCVGKRCMLEGSVRIPLLARLPGFMPEGHECRAAATLLDLMPTVCEAARIGCPELDEARSLRDVAGLRPGERTVFSQFSRSWNGQYFAADGKHTYIHSVADRREWHFQVDDAVTQGPIQEPDRRGAELRTALIERHAGDLYSDAVADGDWKRHEIPSSGMFMDPDYGYLYAEPAEKIQADVDALGPDYARTVTGLAKGHLMAEHMLVPTEPEWQAMGYRAPWLED